MLKNQITRNFDKSNFKFNNQHDDRNDGIECVDEYIREHIQMINSSENFMTFYSCEGHKNSDTAYLFFTVNNKGWKVLWNKIIPELSEKFHFSIGEGVYQLDWHPSVSSKGISIYGRLNDFKINKKTFLYTWEDNKKLFWNSIKESFEKNIIIK